MNIDNFDIFTLAQSNMVTCYHRVCKGVQVCQTACKAELMVFIIQSVFGSS